MVAVALHVGVLLRHLGENFVPEAHGVRPGVGLGGGGDALLAAPLARQLEGEAHHPLGAHAGDDAGLCGQLVGRAHVQAPAHIGVLALGVLAHDHEVDLFLVPQRRNHAGQQAHRAQVDVLPQALAHLLHQPAGADGVGQTPGVAVRAEEDGVEAA